MASTYDLINEIEQEQPSSAGVSSPAVPAPTNEVETEPSYTKEQLDFLGSNRKIGMVDQQGKIHLVPGTAFQAASTLGWKITDEKQESLQSKVDAEKEALDKMPLGAIGNEVMKSFGNAGLGGVPDIIREHYGTDEEKEVDKQIAEEHPIAHYAGAGVGFLTNALTMAAPAEAVGGLAEKTILGDAVGQGIKAGTLKTIAAQGLKDAAIASTFAAPEAGAHFAVGDYDKAAETMLFAGGVGGLLGVGVGGGKALLGGAKDAVGSVIGSVGEKADQLADQLKLEQAGVSVANQKKLAKKGTLQGVLDYLDTGNGEKIPREQLEKELASEGAKIGDHLSYLDDLRDIQKQAGVAAGEEPLIQMKPSQVADGIEKNIKDQIPGIDTDLFASTKKALEDGTNFIRQTSDKLGGDNIKLSDSNDMLNQIRDQMNYSKKSGDFSRQDILKQIARQYKEAQEDVIEKAYAQLPGHEDRFADYMTSKKNYSAIQNLLDYGEQQVKGNTNGGLSGMVARWVATILGGHLAGPIGAGAAYVAEPYMKRWGERALMPSAIRALKKIASNPEQMPLFGAMAAKAGQSALDDEIDKIPSMLVSSSKVLPLAAINPIKSYLGDKANGLSKDQQYQRVADDLTKSQSNPQKVVEEVGKLVNIFGEDPHLADLIARKHFQAIDYLYQSLPKNPELPQPFQSREWAPTAQEKAEFIQKLGVVENPMVAIHKLSNNTITSAEMDALKNIYPKIYGAMVDKIIQTGFQPNPPKLNYTKKVALSNFTGVPLDPSMRPENISALQAVYNNPPPEAKQAAQGPHGQPSKMKGQSLQTNVGRLEGGVGAK